MTEEGKLAEEQIKKWDSLLYPQMYPVALVKDFIRKAFLAGLKAGKPQWHNVKSGDLPPEDTKVLAFMAGGEVCIAHFYRKNVWDKIGIVIAWCEIPKYTEE